jgi:hypothetical protein
MTPASGRDRSNQSSENGENSSLICCFLSHPASIIELLFDSLSTAIDELADLDPAALSDAELHQLVVELHRQSARLASVCTRVVGAWDARGVG